LSKIIVITGGGEGLGRALARRFGAEGETIILLGRTQAKIEAVANELGRPAMAVTCDVSSPDSVRAAFTAIAECHPKIDVLINNAAFFQPFPVADGTDDQILQSIGTNLTGPILCARSAVPLMANGSHIINVSSESVELPFPFFALYQSTKAGLERFSKTLHEELQPLGIRVTTIRAGQMMDADKVWNIDPAMGMRFRQACMERGLNLGERPLSQLASVTEIFRKIIDMPDDLHAMMISLHGRKAG
jgi:3-oxoacyl-[acyl-carrier protein] reductase